MRRGSVLRLTLGLTSLVVVLVAVTPRGLPDLAAVGDPSRPVAEMTAFGLRSMAAALSAYLALVLAALLLAALRLLPSTIHREVERRTRGGLAGGVRQLVGASALVLGVLPLQPLAAHAEAPPVLAPEELPAAPTGTAPPEAPPVLAPEDHPPASRSGRAPRLEPAPPPDEVPSSRRPAAPHPSSPPPEESPAPVASPPAVERSWTVVAGDSFWSIAQQRVRDGLGRTPGDAEVLEPWLALIAVNRDRLIDPDDPDLLHPGQVLRLPPL